jgi:hypothetical protein
MRVTLANMRKAVKGWLQEEKATREQTLELLDVVYAGAIDGGVYWGDRDNNDGELDTSNVRAAGLLAALPEDAENDEPCGCLVDTLERIRGDRPEDEMGKHTSTAFALALRIPFGGTPSNNVWSKAAAQGIEEYYAEKGWR